MESVHSSKKSIDNILAAISGSLFLLTVTVAMACVSGVATHAEGDDEDLGYGISSGNASVTVGTACTFSASVSAPHTSTISNGISSSNIGTTILNTTCNDSGGYAVYAIGYTGEEYGNTSLAYTSLDGNTTNNDYDIVTGTATSGNISNWAMKLNTVSGTTTATIESDTNGSFSSYHIIPDDYVKVAALNTVTDGAAVSSATGSSISTTYQAYISPTQAPGTYAGKVKYTLVHPSTAPAPKKPATINTLTYMQDFATLTAEDKTSVLNSMPEGQQFTLEDSREPGKSYYIAKLKDGNVWMTQNLDLDINSAKTYTSADTNISSNWTPERSTITTDNLSSTTWPNSNNDPYSYDPGDVFYYSSGTMADDTRYTSLEDCQAEHPDCSMKNHAGNYYNWSAAVASNDTSGLTTDYSNAPVSICPAGWRLPVATDSSNTAASREWNALLVAEGIMTNPTGYGYATNGFNNIRKSPLWLARSGDVSYGSLINTASSGDYWSSTVKSSSSAYYLNFDRNGVLSPSNRNRYYGQSVRCLAQ